MGTVELKGNEWKDFIQADYAAIDCYGDGCVACVMLAPYFDAAADELDGIRFGRINISQYPEIADAFSITALPTVLFFRKGEKVHEVTGSMETDDLRAQIAQMLYE